MSLPSIELTGRSNFVVYGQGYSREQAEAAAHANIDNIAIIKMFMKKVCCNEPAVPALVQQSFTRGDKNVYVLDQDALEVWVGRVFVGIIAYRAISWLFG